MNERLSEFENAKNIEEESRLNWFVGDLREKLTHINGQLETEASRLLMSWVLDTISQLQDEYNDDGN